MVVGGEGAFITKYRWGGEKEMGLRNYILCGGFDFRW